jgi:hypothetical protein
MLKKQILCAAALVIFLLCSSSYLRAQPSVIYDNAKQKLIAFIGDYPSDLNWNVAQITLVGNRITRDRIVMREVPVKAGQQIISGELLQMLEASRLNLLNTELFLEVIPVIDSLIENDLYLSFILKERWYIFPLPYFDLVDRNPNQWLFEQNADLDRVNYGIKFAWDNVSGRRDEIRVHLITGYGRQMSIQYQNPYMGKKMEHGYFIGANYSTVRQVSYATDRHKQLFYPLTTRTDIDFVRSSFGVHAGYTYRKGVKYRHRFSIAYREERVADSINKLILLNSGKGYRSFFPANRMSVSFADLNYQYTYLNVNNNAYPWKGMAANLSLTHKGLGLSPIHLWEIGFKAGKYIPFGNKYSLAMVGLGVIKLPFDQPMYNLAGIGFGDMYMRGLEYYVINCVAGGIFKTSMRRELFNINFPTFFKKSDKYRKIPFKVIAKIYGDLGAAHLPFDNAGFLNNQLLYCFGTGFDVLSYYDFTALVNFSVNQLGEKGLFLHIRKEF